MRHNYERLPKDLRMSGEPQSPQRLGPVSPPTPLGVDRGSSPDPFSQMVDGWIAQMDGTIRALTKWTRA